MPLADGELVDADGPRRGIASPAELLLHILLVQILDRMPVEEEFVGDFPDGRLATPPADGEGETLGVEGIVGEPFQAFGLHAVAAPAEDSAKAVSEVDPLVATGEVADAAGPLVVEGPVGLTTDIANRFFRRRLRVMTTAWGSPKRPRMRAWGTNPGNRYRSWRSLNLAIARA